LNYLVYTAKKSSHEDEDEDEDEEEEEEEEEEAPSIFSQRD
jgi:hypothetical protein